MIYGLPSAIEREDSTSSHMLLTTGKKEVRRLGEKGKRRRDGHVRKTETEIFSRQDCLSVSSFFFALVSKMAAIEMQQWV